MVAVRTIGFSLLACLGVALLPASSYATGAAQGDRLESFSDLIGAPPVIRGDFVPSTWSKSPIDDYGRADRFADDAWRQWQDDFGREHRPRGGGWEFGGGWEDHHHFQSPVPEPGVTSLSFAALGAVVLLVARRRRR